MSYQELDSIRAQGIDAIVNLCGEYCDLHEIEEKAGFEVLYLPVDDDRAPALEEMERALDWLDEAIYLGKKILVHCRQGIGRTGTFVTAYFLRRGFGFKLAKKQLQHTRSGFTSFEQWRHLRQYKKKAGELTIREPSLESQHLVDLSPYFAAYERLVQYVDETFQRFAQVLPGLASCGDGTDACCKRFVSLQLIESAHLIHHLNKHLHHDERRLAINRAVQMGSKACGRSVEPEEDQVRSCELGPEGQQGNAYRCPLSVDRKCIAFDYRPIVCRIYGIPTLYQGQLKWWGKPSEIGQLDTLPLDLDRVNEALFDISRDLFLALHATPIGNKSLLFPLTHVVSGKFIQDYFGLLMQMNHSE